MRFLLPCNLKHDDEGEVIRDSQDPTWDARINYDVHLDFWALFLRIADFNCSPHMNNAFLKEGREDSEESN